MVIQGRKLLTIIVLFALVLSIGYDGIRLSQDQRFNRALATRDTAGITAPVDPRRQFAKAYELQQQNAFRQAVKAYADIDTQAHSRLQLDIKFNLANLYFRRAEQLREAGNDDLAMPLIELAKQNYKEILRADSNHWDAKFNLELALHLAPETDPVDALEERNPERSPRALTKIRSAKPLP